jgi:hypothetical protein
MRRFPTARFANALGALVVLVVIVGGSLAIAVTTWRAMGAFDADSEMARTYRAGDNPWSYAWSGGRGVGLPHTSSNYAANAMRQPAGVALDADGASFSLLAQVTVPPDGADGMIITQGGLAGGWAFYIDQGKPVFEYNLDGVERYTIAAARPLAPGPQTLLFSFRFDAKGEGEGGVATITTNGEEIARGRIGKTLSRPFSLNEGLDIGEDTGTPINLSYDPPYKFSGEIGNIVVSFRRSVSRSAGAPRVIYD